MFTGIIEEVGAIVRRSGSDLAVMAKTVLESLDIGDSIAINGACMTVVELTGETFVVQVSPESLKRTTLGALKPGDAVNLERAMPVNGRLDGHFVQGHVDGVGRVAKVEPQGEFSLWTFEAPPEVGMYLIPKGSIAVDGISLTVVEPGNNVFCVAVIPETLRNTTLQSKTAGDPVNLEADLLGKHIYHYLQQGSSGITKDLLAQNGFI